MGHDPVSADASDSRRYDNRILAGFTAATFLSSFLLFLVQPLFTKMVLPVLGGGPSVWAVALFFFQAALLAGYLLAHGLTRFASLRQAGFIHLGLFAAAALTLPIGLPRSFAAPPVSEPYLWQLGLFTLGIGLPFVVLAANAPLLQAWFARTTHAQARDPYFLYAASNSGSLLALLGYPFLLEPALGAGALARFWAGGFIVLGALIALVLWWLQSAVPERSNDEAARTTDAGPAPSWPTVLGWIGLAFVPSALLTAFTTHIATDIASAPLLWVLPLALFLLTFVLVFRERSAVPQPLLLGAHLIAVIVALYVMAANASDSLFLSIGTGLAAFFTTAMVAHRTLYLSRPAAGHLTAFYLWMALGGGLGGMFAALIAPKLFSGVFEYPLLIALSIACRPGVLAQIWPRKGRAEMLLTLWIAVACGALAIYWLPRLGATPDELFGNWTATAVIAAAFAGLALLAFRAPLMQFVAAMGMVAAVVLLPSGVNRGAAERSYFGVYRVETTEDGAFRYLMHGTTLHGAQLVGDGDGNPIINVTPATYYHPQGPMARTIEAVRARAAAAGKPLRYGIVGLGAGALACYTKPGEGWRFYEIDPLVVRIASNPARFTFLSTCQPAADIVLGDARLTLAREPAATFDLLLIDAFSSDAVPIHLMTKEALQLYLSKLKPGGIALLHISNQHLDLDAVLGATLPGVPGAAGLLLIDDEDYEGLAASASSVALIANAPPDLDAFRSWPEAKPLQPGLLNPWSDDHSDIIGPFLRKLKEE